MTSQFDTPAGRSLLTEVRSLFEKSRVFRRNDVPFVFVCGGPTDKNTMRKQFLDCARGELPEVVIVLAEQAFRDTLFHDPPQTYNLSVFESLIAEISDCVILFPESPGAFAEMGYFSATKKISAKTLVVNDLRYQATDSFVNLGPINTINRSSFLNPALHVEAGKASGIDFSPIKTRLERLMNRKKRKSLTHRPYGELTRLERFVIIMEIINLLHITSLRGLVDCIRAAFDTLRLNEIKQLLSVLVGSGCVKRVGDDYVLAKGVRSGLEFEGVDVRDLKTRVLHYYRKYSSDYYEHVTRGTP